MARKQAAAKPQKRDGYWYLIRRVPAAFRDVDRRGIIFLTTGIKIVDDPRGSRAQSVVDTLDRALMQFWQDKRAGRDVEAADRYRKARDRANELGYPYVPAAEAAQLLPIEDILRRLESLSVRGTAENPLEVAALLGGETNPGTMLSTLVDAFEEIMAPSLMKKSERQRKKWRVEKDSALKTFITAIGGDKAIEKLSRADGLALRSYYQERIVSGEVEIDTANKYMGRVSAMLKQVNKTRQLDVAEILAGLRFDGAQKKQRVAYAPAFVQERFLAEGMFQDLNEEARRIVYLVIETGLRLSEACNLCTQTIKLDAAVPHVQVRADLREMKTEQSERDIPLVGVALKVMRLQPHGFPRYRDHADTLSALVNSALIARALRPEPGQSLYSLRHTFEDRLTAVEAPEKVVASLMGHKWHRPRYGLGPSLKQKEEWLKRIAFKPPLKV